MNLPYIIETQVCFAFLWLIYRLFMHNSGKFAQNRAFLLAIIAVSFIIPLVSIPVYDGRVFYIDPSAPSLIEEGAWIPTVPAESAFDWKNVILGLYIAGALSISCVLIKEIIRLRRFMKGKNANREDKVRVIRTDVGNKAFSFFNYIFISDELGDKEEIKPIIAHEMCHVRLGHSIDSVIAQFMKIVFWWSPFVWLWSRSLKEVHEYQADEEVLNLGFDSENYINLILGNLCDTYPELVSGFSYSLIKKRLTMISRNNKGIYAKFRILLALPAVFALLMLFSFTEKDARVEYVNTVHEETMPDKDLNFGSDSKETSTIDHPHFFLEKTESGTSTGATNEYFARIPDETTERLRVRQPEMARDMEKRMEVLQKEMDAYQKQVEPEMQKRIEEAQKAIARYEQSTGKKLQERMEVLQKEMDAYEPEMQKRMEEMQKEMARYEQSTGKKLQEHMEVLKKEMDAYKPEMQKRMEEMQKEMVAHQQQSVQKMEEMQGQLLAYANTVTANQSQGSRVNVPIFDWEKRQARRSGTDPDNYATAKASVDAAWAAKEQADTARVRVTVRTIPEGGTRTITRDSLSVKSKAVNVTKDPKTGMYFADFDETPEAEKSKTYDVLYIKANPEASVTDLASALKTAKDQDMAAVISVTTDKAVENDKPKVEIIRIVRDDDTKKVEPKAINIVRDSDTYPPVFPEGDFKAWVSKNVKYPAAAKEKGIAGRVVYSFYIDFDGSITDLEIKSSPDQSLSDEVLRVIRSAPKWKPGKKDGKVIRGHHSGYVDFTLM